MGRPNLIEMIPFWILVVRSIEDLFFPHLCKGCGQVLARPLQVICPQCEIMLPSAFALAGHTLEGMEKLKTKYALCHCFALYNFRANGQLEKLLYSLKYQNQSMVGTYFGRKLAAYVRQENLHYDGIIGVPLHPKRRHKRGYNQVDILGKMASELLNIPYCGKVLIRTKNTPPLSKIKKDRTRVLAHAFAIDVTAIPHCGHYLLIDDIFTTGATLDACLTLLVTHTDCRFSIGTIAYRI